MAVWWWAAVGFWIGSLPFSVWLTRWAVGADVRQFGDGNPGGINAWKAGGPRVGVPAILLDFSKGALPVLLARRCGGLSGWALVPAALAPVAGHALSPFLGFRGGKALAATFGMWTGLTLWEGPTVLGLWLALALWFCRSDAWVMVTGMGGLLGYWLWRGAEPYVLGAWAGNALILAWTHRGELRRRPEPRRWLGMGR